jgi:iron complex outermembrane recepter protein
MKLKLSLLATSALLAALVATSAQAQEPAAPPENVIDELVVTAEKRAQNVQDVPVAISVFTDQQREIVGINSIQDMTNYTPGLQYNSSTDRISLRGVGRLTNVLSAEASVANYNDGIFETFAVQAGRSTLFLDRVEILRGPQGTLYGRNAIGGAINQISKRPTDYLYAEARAGYANYQNSFIEGAISGPLFSGIEGRFSGSWINQEQGWIKNIVPGLPEEGGVRDEIFLEAQLQGTFLDEKLDVWTKFGWGRWRNGAGGPGSQSAGWTAAPFPTYEFGPGATTLNAGYGCDPATTNVVNPSPLGCVNPAQTTPWTIARAIPYEVELPIYNTVAIHLTWHAEDFDIRYVTGGVNYHYELRGPVASANLPNSIQAPITSFTLPGGLVIAPAESFDYREYNSFWSHEVTLLSTHEGPVQWVTGAYYYAQDYRQPVFTRNPSQPQWNGPFGVPSFFCARTGGVCAPGTDFRRFDNRPEIHAESYAVYGQVDWSINEKWKTALGLRYSHDEKTGTESVRILCFAVPACFAPPELHPFIPGGIPAVDLTQLPTVVSAPAGTPTDPFPQGVTGPTTYDPATGFASRNMAASWEAVTGTAGVEWTPDEDTLVYAKYSRGYKSGGLYVGIVTVLSFDPYSDKESVDAYEVGVKKNFGDTLQTNAALFHYKYTDFQIPIASVSTTGGLTQGSVNFENIPEAMSQGLELEVIWQPINNLQILATYSYLDTEIQAGEAIDSTDPAALDPRAQPVRTVAECQAAASTANFCPVDIYTVGVPNGGFARSQSLAGNRLPNAPENKFSLNVNYTWLTDIGDITGSVSYIWRDKQYGTLFTRSYNESPAWDQVDARVAWDLKNGKTRVIAYVKNVFDDIGYDAGATATRFAGTSNSAFGAPTNTIQGVFSTYSVTPPRTYGIELQYKFF